MRRGRWRSSQENQRSMAGTKAGQEGKKHRQPPVEKAKRKAQERAGGGKAGRNAGSSRPPSVPLLLALASVVGIMFGLVAIGLNMASVATYGRGPVSSAPDPIKSDPHSKGNPNAPILVEEYSDFQCPACRLYNLRIEPDFEKAYVDTGKVRFVSRDYPFLGPESYLAAEAAEAAAAQGKYWAYNAILWQRQGPENSGTFSAANLKQFASEVGLDRKAFDTALDTGQYRQQVLDQRREAESRGINATPSFFINGKKIPGVPTMDTWPKIIDQELSSNK